MKGNPYNHFSRSNPVRMVTPSLILDDSGTITWEISATAPLDLNRSNPTDPPFPFSPATYGQSSSGKLLRVAIREYDLTSPTLAAYLNECGIILYQAYRLPNYTYSPGIAGYTADLTFFGTNWTLKKNVYNPHSLEYDDFAVSTASFMIPSMDPSDELGVILMHTAMDEVDGGSI